MVASKKTQNNNLSISKILAVMQVFVSGGFTELIGDIIMNLQMS